MDKIRVEVCMVGARGLRRSSSLWKLQWFAVGWIDPNSKYCSKIDSSGGANPTWNTKFAAAVDDSKVSVQDLVLTVEVYRRDPVFLGEKLYGTATVALREYFNGKSEAGSGSTDMEVGSFQLRKKRSGKPRGFVDVSIRVYGLQEAGGVAAQYPDSGSHDLEHSDGRTGMSFAIGDGPVVAYPSTSWRRRRPSAVENGNYNSPAGHRYLREPHGYPSHPESQPGYPHHNQGIAATSYPQTHIAPGMPGNYSPPGGRPPAPRRGTPPPPPPPSNTGFIPSFFPGMGQVPESYVSVPSTAGRAARGVPPGFTTGLGAGAIAAGAVIFGDDFMATSDFPTGYGGGGLTISAEPPF